MSFGQHAFFFFFVDSGLGGVLKSLERRSPSLSHFVPAAMGALKQKRKLTNFTLTIHSYRWLRTARHRVAFEDLAHILIFAHVVTRMRTRLTSNLHTSF